MHQSSDDREFLANDLKWKAVAIQDRIASVRRSRELPMDWSRTHANIAGVALELVKQAGEGSRHASGAGMSSEHTA